MGYAWVSVAQDVDWEGQDVGETLGAVVRLALAGQLRPTGDGVDVLGKRFHALLVKSPYITQYVRALRAHARNGREAQWLIRSPELPAVLGELTHLERLDIGARVDDQTVLTTLDDLSEVEIEFSVPEIFFGRVRQGQAVSFPRSTGTRSCSTLRARRMPASRSPRCRIRSTGRTRSSASNR